MEANHRLHSQSQRRRHLRRRRPLLDGGSLGYVFTNQFGIITAFVPHPGVDNKEMGIVRNQRIFLGQPGSGLDGIEVKPRSSIDRKLKTLGQIAAAKNMPPDYRSELEKFTNLLPTRQFEWKLPPAEE